MKQILIENEPNKIYPHIQKGWGNGYVTLSKGNELWGKDYDDINEYIWSKFETSIHGGLTYSNEIQEKHINDDWFKGQLTTEDIGDWMVGFDTAHYGDDLTNCSKEFVIEETQRLYEMLYPTERKIINLNKWKSKSS
jgi:hypothetical protein